MIRSMAVLAVAARSQTFRGRWCVGGGFVDVSATSVDVARAGKQTWRFPIVGKRLVAQRTQRDSVANAFGSALPCGPLFDGVKSRRHEVSDLRTSDQRTTASGALTRIVRLRFVDPAPDALGLLARCPFAQGLFGSGLFGSGCGLLDRRVGQRMALGHEVACSRQAVQQSLDDRQHVVS